MKILVTGAAGFIGAAVSQYLINRGDEVVGIDNINDYYDVNLKHARLAGIKSSSAASRFSFIEMGVEDREGMAALFEQQKFDGVIHLAAQAGVRYSLENPNAYIDSNVVGFMNILEGCRHTNIPHLVYASSSSVYGSNKEMPFSEKHNVDHPVSIYAATKKANELMAHTYSHLYGLVTTGLRFFTVYGPWGRPDMAPMKFAKAISSKGSIDVYNYGEHRRDFTYIDDIVEGVVRSLDRVDCKGSNTNISGDKYEVINIGAQTPVHLLSFIELMEKAFDSTVSKNLLPIQPGDVPDTYADVSRLTELTGYQPKTSIEEGVEKFALWYKSYYSN
ncbi:NAD-dependent epimerase [Alteromonas hispanica]|uniref:NAD-dependent epimerase/dehydratase family protein n=1 Tax=Alteromonas hispanica TaxID=315421 RepID=A0A6L9MUJ3_9ALTE|nr:NAD-dependent epimerase [Alteromonas hispanica]NDW21585.1 NAD-dependent epimerase/dehydratase family protein [Alteromonas hispanica]